MATNKRQHYVHQAYLRQFSSDEKQIYVYDKVLNKSWEDGIRNVAQETYFYRLPEGLSDRKSDPIDPQLAEKWFQTLEDNVLRDIKELSDLSTEQTIPIEIRKSMAIWIAIQNLRTRATRDAITDLTEGLVSKVNEHVIKANFGEEFIKFAPKVTYTEEAARLFHVQQILKGDLVAELAGILDGHVWSLVINDTDQLFYTSDTPVVLYNHIPRPRFRPGKGLGSKGIEINYPISSTRLITLRHHELCGDRAGEFDNRVGIATTENVEFFNSLQVIECERQVYCEYPQWDLVEDMIRESPGLSEKKSRIGFN